MPDLVTARALREQRMKLYEDAKSAMSKDDVTPDDEKRADDLMAQMGEFTDGDREATGLAAKIERAEKIERLEITDDDDRQLRAMSNKDYAKVKAGDAPTPEEHRMAFHAWSMPDKATPDQIRAAEKCGWNLHSKTATIPMYRQAPRTLAECRATSDALAQGTAAFGGNTVPNEAMRAMEESMLMYGGVRNVANIQRTATGATLPVPTVDDTGNKGAILAENTATTIHTVVFGQRTLGAYKYTSRLIQASLEFLQDTSINAPAWIGEQVGTRIARAQATHYAVGAGSTATTPAGLIGIEGGSTTVSSKLGKTSSTYNQVIFTELMDLIHSVDPAYRRSPNCRFVFNDNFLLRCKQVTISSSEAVPLWLPSVREGTPDTILGYPYTVDQDVASLSATTSGGLRVAGFGDTSKYWVREVMGVQLMRLDERYAEYGQVAWVGFARSDAGLMNIDAFKHLITATT